MREAQAKVADFGLARRMQPRGAQDGSSAMAAEATVVLGTFGYVAPEYACTGAIYYYLSMFKYPSLEIRLLKCLQR